MVSEHSGDGHRECCYSVRVRRALMHEDEASLRLEASISGLANRVPGVSVRRLLTPGQRRLMIVLVALIVLGFVLSAIDTIQAIVGIVTVVYVVCVAYRVYLFVRSTRADVSEIVTDEEARARPRRRSSHLHGPDPRVPRARGHQSPDGRASARLEYPANRLEVLLLVEADDEETIDAISDEDPGSPVHTGARPARRASDEAQGPELRSDAGTR